MSIIIEAGNPIYIQSTPGGTAALVEFKGPAASTGCRHHRSRRPRHCPATLELAVTIAVPTRVVVAVARTLRPSLMPLIRLPPARCSLLLPHSSSTGNAGPLSNPKSLAAAIACAAATACRLRRPAAACRMRHRSRMHRRRRTARAATNLGLVLASYEPHMSLIRCLIRCLIRDSRVLASY